MDEAIAVMGPARVQHVHAHARRQVGEGAQLDLAAPLAVRPHAGRVRLGRLVRQAVSQLSTTWRTIPRRINMRRRVC